MTGKQSRRRVQSWPGVQSETKDVVTPILKALHGLPWCCVERQQSGKARGGKMRLARPGAFDIVGGIAGVPVGIECKRPGAEPTDEQRAYHDMARRAGFVVLVTSEPRDATELWRKLCGERGLG